MVNTIIHFSYAISSVLFFVLAVGLICSATAALIRRRQRAKISGLKKASWKSASGLVFGKTAAGRIVCAPSRQDGKHAAIIGGSGSGKTSSIFCPCLLHWPGTFLALDIAGDISAAVHPKNSLIFDPLSPDTPPYNIFAPVDLLQEDPAAQFEQLEKLAFLLMPDTAGAGDAGRFFNSEGRKILTAALVAFYHAGMDFPEICRLIVANSCADLFRKIDAQGVPQASLLIRSFSGTNEANTAGCKQAADSAVKLFALGRNMQHAIRRPAADETAASPAALENLSIFCRIPEDRIDLYAPLLRVIVCQAMAHAEQRPLGAELPILFALDEFPSLRIDATTIVGALQRFRKRNVSILLAAQSMAALDRIYNATTRIDMLNNCVYKVVLRADDPDTQMELARMIGKKDQKRTSITTGKGASSYTEQTEKVWAVDPESLGRLGNKLLLIHPAGFEILRKAPFFKYKR